jgi:glutathione S-transferase
MQLFSANRAPNPRRVLMFLAEKGITDIEVLNIDLNAGAHKTPEFLAKSPLAKVPALVLDDGRVLCESRAICTYLEGVNPEPNLLGTDTCERAFIEMADRQVELTLLLQIANAVRHSHPGLVALEQPQFADFAASQADKMLATARVFGQLLEWMAGARFSIADITAFCALEFARGLMKFTPARAGLTALQAWRDRVAERPSARAV